MRVERPHGGYLEQRYRPLERVGICVPGGAAAYPSTVLMTAVPAQVAGVKQLAVVAPPTPFGAYNADLLATCHELGISEVYRLGGAQGVAALAYGVEGLPRVDKIVGPGNLFVALAKKPVYGEVDIDSIAGPSEVVVIVDDSTRADFTAADLIAQAEHAPGASILIAWSAEAAGRRGRGAGQANGAARAGRAGPAEPRRVRRADPRPRRRRSRRAGRRDRAGAPAHRHRRAPKRCWPAFAHAGAVFLGNYTPVAVGDYAAGPSHVLPTGGTARFASGLSANDFLRSHSVIHCTREGLAGAGRRRAHAGRQGRPDGPSRERRRAGLQPMSPWLMPGAVEFCPTTTQRLRHARMTYFRPEIERWPATCRASSRKAASSSSSTRTRIRIPPSPAVGAAIAAVHRTRAGQVSRSDGHRRFAAARPKCWASSPTGSSAATAATTS